MNPKHLLAILLACTCLPATSQTAAPSQQSEFEVASIRMVNPLSEEDVLSGKGNSPINTFPANRFTAHHLTLKLLIGLAYEVDDKYIQGDPDWLDSQNYDIEAKVDGDKELSYEQMKPLIQHLLVQRFHLATHRVMKTTSGYALIVAKGGTKLLPSKDGATPHAQLWPDRIQMWSMTAKDFAGLLSRPTGFPVIDKTDIQGVYDVDLHYAPANHSDSNLPDLFTALHEQLGLKLESQRVPVESLLIDHVERTPTEN